MHCLLLEEDIAWKEEGHIVGCFGGQALGCSTSRLLHLFVAPFLAAKGKGEESRYLR